MPSPLFRATVRVVSYDPQWDDRPGSPETVSALGESPDAARERLHELYTGAQSGGLYLAEDDWDAEPWEVATVEPVLAETCVECECHFEANLLRVVEGVLWCVPCGVETGALCEHCTAVACDCAVELERDSEPLTADECGLRGW